MPPIQLIYANFKNGQEYIFKMRYLYTMEFHSATKENEILSFAGKWMELENTILSEVRLRRPKAACSLICGI
jgi:hypothetical protein